MLKSGLLFPDLQKELKKSMPCNSDELIHDLDLENIFMTMSQGDTFVLDVCRRVLMNIVSDRETILYRQRALDDVLQNPEDIRDLYSILVDSINEARKRVFWISTGNPEFNLHESLLTLEIYLKGIEGMRRIAEASGPKFTSTAFSRFFKMLEVEFDDKYLELVRGHLESLKFQRGINVTGKIVRRDTLHYNLVVPEDNQGGLRGKFILIGKKHYTFVLPDRDESGAQAISRMRSRSIFVTSEIMKRSAENVLRFMISLREEIAFYVGCINLEDRLKETGATFSFPFVSEAPDQGMHYTGIYDVSMCLRVGSQPVSNSLDSERSDLIIVTGANRGGKTTLLRSLGQAQLMMQAGLFVGADMFRSHTVNGLFTHFKHEEDKEMKLGKFEEEIKRFSEIVDHITCGSRLLFNESFSSTNVNEATIIAGQIIEALLQRNISIIFVTHLYGLTERFISVKQGTVFLVAERLTDGTRTFHVLPSEPIQTSYGIDIFRKVFAGFKSGTDENLKDTQGIMKF